MTLFHYRSIGRELFDELLGAIAAGESSVLLAPRYGGGRHAMFRLRETAEREGLDPLVLKLARRSDLRDASAVRRRVDEEASRLFRGNATVAPSADGMLGAVKPLTEHTKRPALLLAANVDALPYPLAGRFLEEVRTLVQDGLLVAVLSGEDTFFDLVQGPKAEFNCAQHFVLQGMTLEELTAFAERYRETLGLDFEDPGPVYQEIWRQTGGNRHLLRTLLWEILERRGRSDEGRPLDQADIESLIRRSNLPGLYGSEIFRHATRLVAHEPRSWPALEALLDRRPLVTSAAHSKPTQLELAGVAVRQGTRLAFSSPWMEKFLVQHFDDRRWGDLNARFGLWDQAFDHYGRLPHDETVRPVNADDRIEVELTVRNLTTELYSEIHRGTERLRSLFCRGCRAVLGYADIVFLHHGAGGWETVSDAAPMAAEPRQTLARVVAHLPADGSFEGILNLPEPWFHQTVAATFPGRRPTQRFALVLGDFQRHTWISRERRRLTLDLLGHFLKAWSHALNVERERDRLAVRNEHVELMNAIFNALGSQVLDVRRALEMAAGGLRKLGYRRVLLCLVDPTGTRIQGELDDSDEGGADVAAMTDYGLDAPDADLQPWVVHHRTPKIVPDARNEPLANGDVVRATGMRALAIVPILHPNGQALGTIHVEREDQAVPSEAEVEDLLLFGRQLAIAIEQSERVNLLQSALDQIPEPVLVADGRRFLRYLNQPAADLLRRQGPGWFDRDTACPLDEAALGQASELMTKSLAGKQRLAKEIRGFGLRPEYRGVALTDDILVWKKRILGAVLHLQDLNYLFRVFEAFQHIAQASDTESAMRAVLEGLHGLGHRKGRLFLIDGNDSNRLVSRYVLSADGRVAEDVERAPLPARGEAGVRTWLCIEVGEPRIGCWREDLPDGVPVITAYGLEAVNANPPRCPGEVDKQPGDFWIDIPLLTSQEVHGKLSVGCDPDLRPEDFHLLRILAGMASELLESFIRHDRVMRGFEKQGELAMAVAAHNINTRLGVLPVVLARYRNREKGHPHLSGINDDLEHVITETLGTIRQIKRHLAAVKAERHPVSLRSLLEKSLERALAPSQWSLLPGDEVIADVDGGLVESALLELFHNSRVMIERGDLHITLSVETDPSRRGVEWVRIVYRDNGPGIPEHLKQRIFEHFFSRRPGQTNSNGLGLNFVARILEAHGGIATETGTAGEGARFVLAFPRFAAPPPEDKEPTHG